MRSTILLALASVLPMFVSNGPARAQHAEPPAAESAQGPGTPMGTLGEAEAPYVRGSYLASDLIGQTVQNDQGQTLGKLRTVLIDKSGQIRYGVLEEDGSIWGEGESYMVPWQRFTIDANKRVRLNVSQRDLSSQFQRFEPGDSNEGKSPSGGETGGAIG